MEVTKEGVNNLANGVRQDSSKNGTSPVRNPSCDVLRDTEHGARIRKNRASLAFRTPGSFDPSAAVIVAASFIANIIFGGLVMVAGQYLPAFLDAFAARRSEASWVISLQGSTMYLSGAACGPLINRFGTRTVAIAGSICSSAGLLISSSAFNIIMLYFTFGILAGTGYGMLLVTTNVAVQQHTSRRRALAGGLALCGTGIGGFCMPRIINWSMELYGWSGSLMFMTGVLLHCLPCAMLLHPPANDCKQEADVEVEISQQQLVDSGKDASHAEGKLTRTPGHTGTCTSKVEVSGILTRALDKTICSMPNLYIRSGGIMNRTHRHLEGGSYISLNERDLPASPTELKSESLPRKFDSSGVLSTELERKGMLTELERGMLSTKSESGIRSIDFKSEVLSTEPDSKIFRPATVCAVFSWIFFYSGKMHIYIFCAVKAASIGLSARDSAAIMSFAFLSEALGRVTAAAIGSCHDLVPVTVFVVNLIVSGISMGIFGFSANYGQMMASAVVFGLAMGFAMAMASTVMRDIAGLTHFPVIIGCAYTLGGIGILSSVQLFAFIWEKTNSLILPHVIGGCFLGISAVIMSVAKLKYGTVMK